MELLTFFSRKKFRSMYSEVTLLSIIIIRFCCFSIVPRALLKHCIGFRFPIPNREPQIVCTSLHRPVITQLIIELVGSAECIERLFRGLLMLFISVLLRDFGRDLFFGPALFAIFALRCEKRIDYKNILCFRQISIYYHYRRL